MASSMTDYSNHEKMARFGELFAELASSSGGVGGRRSSLTDRHEDVDFDELDGDDDIFGTPEEHTRQPSAMLAGGGARRAGSSQMPCMTVIDACLVCDEDGLCEILRKGVTKGSLNKKHPKTGRTGLAYACAQGYLGILDILVGMGPILDVNAADNEGNTPLHLAAEAGHADVLSNLLAFFRDVQIDSRNHSGLTPLMKSAIQGRTNCAKILLFAGACPALRDAGRCLNATEWARLCGRHGTADIIERFPHTSCLLHPSAHTHHPVQSSLTDRATSGGQVAQRLAYPSAPPQVFPVRPVANGHSHSSAVASHGYSHDSPKGLTVRRTYRASSEPNLQARPSVQLQLEQLQGLNQAPLRRRPSWIRKKLKQALGFDKHSQQRKSLQPSQMNRFGSTPSLSDGVGGISLPFACTGFRNASHDRSHGKSKTPMVVPKVKIQHTDSQQDLVNVEQPEKKHKLDFKRVMMFRKRSSSTSTQSSKKI